MIASASEEKFSQEGGGGGGFLSEFVCHDRFLYVCSYFENHRSEESESIHF